VGPSFSLTRADLAGRTRAVLHRGNRRNPDVLLVDAGGRDVVVKDFAPRGPWVRRWLGRWITDREVRAYRALAGHPAVPELLGRIDALALAVEHRPGRRPSRRNKGELPPGFVVALEGAVAEMHARGVAHLDLRHRSNLLADEKGRPVLIDFASAVCFAPGGLGARLLLPLLAWIDRRALAKWRERLAPDGGAQLRSSGGSATGGASEGGRGASRPT
jgi:hypothetical protein